MDLKVDSKKMEVWEEEIVEVVDKGLLVEVEERTVVEDRIAYNCEDRYDDCQGGYEGCGLHV